MTPAANRPIPDEALSQSAFVRGFIDDPRSPRCWSTVRSSSQSAFVRGFIDDVTGAAIKTGWALSQSAFVRGFIDDKESHAHPFSQAVVSIRVRARLHR